VSTMAIQSLPSGAKDASRLASRLGVPVDEIVVHRFPDTELRVSIAPAAPTTVVYAPLDRPNEKLVALLFAAEALRRNGAKRLVLVAPYLCYMRQDMAFNEREAVSQKIVGRLLADAFDRIVTVDAHLHRTLDIHDVFPGIEADNLSAMSAIAEAVRTAGHDPRTMVIGPDAESRAWVSKLADQLGITYAIAQKTRRGDRSVEVVLPDPKIVAGRPALLVDDIVSSGGTLVACTRSLIAAGATSVDAIITHALFPAGATAEFVRAGIRSVRSTTSVPHATNAIALDGLLAEALQIELSTARAEEKAS
jgi:ribose-phosphate pyrophosphokinase